MKKTNVIEVLDSLKLPLIIGVVLIHCNFTLIMPRDADDIRVFSHFITCWDYVLKLMVPAFFFISGYLFFRSGLLTAKTYVDKLRRRLRTLILPYVLWNMIGMLLTLLKTMPFMSSYFPQYEELFGSWKSVLWGFIAVEGTSYPYDMPMWFMRNLIMLVLVSPVVSILFRCLKWLLPVICGGFMIWVSTDYLFLLSSLYFFTLGGASALYEVDFEKVSDKTSYLVVGYAVMCICNGFNPEIFAAVFYQTLGVLAIVCLAFRLPLYKAESRFLRKAQFFIYACHGLYATVVIKVALTLLPLRNSLMAFLDYAVIFVINMSITLSLYLILRKLSPRLLMLLSGGRA